MKQITMLEIIKSDDDLRKATIRFKIVTKEDIEDELFIESIKNLYMVSSPASYKIIGSKVVSSEKHNELFVKIFDVEISLCFSLKNLVVEFFEDWEPNELSAHIVKKNKTPHGAFILAYVNIHRENLPEEEKKNSIEKLFDIRVKSFNQEVTSPISFEIRDFVFDKKIEQEECYRVSFFLESRNQLEQFSTHLSKLIIADDFLK